MTFGFPGCPPVPSNLLFRLGTRLHQPLAPWGICLTFLALSPLEAKFCIRSILQGGFGFSTAQGRPRISIPVSSLLESGNGRT